MSLKTRLDWLEHHLKPSPQPDPVGEWLASLPTPELLELQRQLDEPHNDPLPAEFADQFERFWLTHYGDQLLPDGNPFAY